MARSRSRKTPEDVMMKSAEFVGWALGGLEREIVQTRERLAALTAEAARLRTRFGRKAAPGPVAVASLGAPAGRRRRGRLSAEGRRRISEAMKKRWAEHRRKKSAS